MRALPADLAEAVDDICDHTAVDSMQQLLGEATGSSDRQPHSLLNTHSKAAGCCFGMNSLYTQDQGLAVGNWNSAPEN